ncbi:MAG: tyrosine-type recombinase/integrase, partial [Pyrinomonadaceae bacterium]|nr:tyrosine-type recombinase/integrase [Phycisphaerales bacterium]
TVTGMTDYKLSEQLAAKLEHDAMLRERGLIDPVMERLAEHGKRPIQEFIDEYELYLDSKRNTGQHILETLALIEDVVERCRWETIAHIEGPQLSQDLGRLIAAGTSARTANKRRQAVRGFCRWLVREGRLRIDPLAGVAAIRQRDDVRLKRRALTDEEAARLIAVAVGGSVIGKLTGVQRAWLYKVALHTGYRASELLSLTPRSFNLSRRLVVLQAKSSKRRQIDEQPVPRELCDEIAPWLKEHDGDQRLWLTEHDYTAIMVKADLRAAGIDPEDHGEGCLDFHALRHTYITRLMRANVPPKVMQTLARHSTIQLTLDRYSHLGLSDPAAAIDSLPSLSGTPAKLRRKGA